MKKLFILVFFVFLTSCNAQNKDTMDFEIKKTDNVWKAIRSEEEYRVLREKGTERAFTAEYYDHFAKGIYVCAGCDNQLFESNTKFDSHCGWPSFDKAIKGSVVYETDLSFGMVRTEVMCAKCGGHLGHVFDDGPKETTGKRYCTNSVSIKFIPEK